MYLATYNEDKPAAPTKSIDNLLWGVRELDSNEVWVLINLDENRIDNYGAFRNFEKVEEKLSNIDCTIEEVEEDGYHGYSITTSGDIMNHNNYHIIPTTIY